MCIDGKQDTPLAERWQTPEPLLNEDDADAEDAEYDDGDDGDDYGMETPRAATTPLSGTGGGKKSSSVSFAATTPAGAAVESVRQSLAKMRYADTSPTIISRFIYVCM